MDEPMQPLVRAAGEGHALWHLGALLTFKAVNEETDGRFWAVEGHADHHMAVPLHSHANDDEIWFVAEGEIEFTAGDRVSVAGPGGFAWIPRGVPHTFRVISDTARWYGVGLPGGFSRWFFETGAPAETHTLPPTPPPPTEEQVAALVQSLQAYGTDTLGPPPA